MIVNGVAPESVSVPVCAPFSNVSSTTEPAGSFKTTLPPTLTEPDSKRNLGLLSKKPSSTPVSERSPESARVEIVEVMLVMASPVRVVVVPPTVRDAALMVPNPDIVAVLLPPALFCIVMASVTVRTMPVLTTKSPPPEPKSILFAAASAVTVIAIPVVMTTSSPEPGTPPPQPLHVAGTFQSPLATAVQVAA